MILERTDSRVPDQATFLSGTVVERPAGPNFSSYKLLPFKGLFFFFQVPSSSLSLNTLRLKTYRKYANLNGEKEAFNEFFCMGVLAGP